MFNTQFILLFTTLLVEIKCSLSVHYSALKVLSVFVVSNKYRLSTRFIVLSQVQGYSERPSKSRRDCMPGVCPVNNIL